MYSFVVMAAFATAPETTAFHRRRAYYADSCCAPVNCCDSCGGYAPMMAPGAYGPGPGTAPGTAPAPKKMPAPGVRTDAGFNQGIETTSTTIEIPDDLRQAIDGSNKRDEIYGYLHNNEVPLQARQHFMNQVRQQLLPSSGTTTTAPQPNTPQPIVPQPNPPRQIQPPQPQQRNPQ
jgi:hypothetical protein